MIAQPAASFDTLAIARSLEAELRERGAPGASIAVVRGGRVVWQKALGVRSAETGEPMTTETLVRIGSVTKTVTAVTALLLEQSGRLSLDAPVGTVAPDLTPAMGRLTMRRLLNHTAGLVNEGAGNGAQDERVLGERVRGWGAEKLFTDPGEIYSYSSPGFWLAGYIIEKAAGRPYADVVDSLVLKPLGMRGATHRPTVALTYPLALDHRRGQDGAPAVIRPYPNDASTWPSGSLFASAAGLARFAAALLGDGVVDGQRVLPAAVVAKMRERDPSTVLPGSDCGTSFGLAVCDRNGVRVLSHYGFRGGSGAVLSLVPSKDLAVVILANGPGAILGRTEAVALGLTGDGAPLPSNAHVAARAREVAGAYAAGPDTLRVEARGDSAWYRYGAQPRARALVTADGRVVVLGANGEPAQEFQLVRGRSGRGWYLTDGLNAFRKIP